MRLKAQQRLPTHLTSSPADDAAVALPAAQDDEELSKENIKSTKVGVPSLGVVGCRHWFAG